MPTALLVVSVIGLLFTINAWRPARVEVLSVVTFFAGWLTSELPLHHLAWQAVATGFFIASGALRDWPGWVGLGLTLVSWAGLVAIARSALQAGTIADRALGLESPASGAKTRSWLRLAMPFAMRERGVTRVKDIAYVEGGGARRRLDIYRPSTPVAGAPVLFYIHGGGWVIGDKREQGLPMMWHLAARGWVCVTANYRLSPKVAFPEHLIDVKRALAWVKTHIQEHGGDPSRIVVSGGSAGGHLAALIALTAGRPELQPGFEDADLRVEGAVPIYGVYDFTNRDGIRGPGFGQFIEKWVMQTNDPALYALASPMDQVGDHAPPFFVIHGANDTLVPVQEARSFVRMLRAVSNAPVAYAELPRTQHAFEVFRSIRTTEIVPRVEAFLRAVVEPAER
ncbi:MAG: alpha/beta hydrolase [Acidimicrobiales bacterium]